MRLEVVDVRKVYEAEVPVEVLAGVSFEISAGEAVAVTGPSGSGKSTLLHLIGGLDRPTSGTLRADGHDLAGFNEKELARYRNRDVGFVFQDHHLLPQYTVLENVVLPGAVFRESRDRGALVDRARELLERVGLGARIHHRPAQLSGGERQRAAVARAMIRRPAMLLCDEPTGSLDRESASAVAELLFELHSDAGNILIVVTHSSELAARFFRTLALRDGLCSDR